MKVLPKQKTIALVLLALSYVQANIIGLDFGSNYMKATLVKPGQPFSIVENTASKRKTETMLTIGVDNRLWGADSFLESAKYPKTTFSEIQRTFGQKFDADLVSKFKEERYVTNEFVADERGYVAWKVTKPAMGDEESEEQILYNEEVMAMLLGYVKMLAEKQAGGSVRDCVITIPSWFTYEQRLMVKDAAEGLAGLNVLQLVHENTAAATMFAIDHRAKIEPEKNLTVLFYNMGGMDTEVLIAQYKLFNVSAKKQVPYIDILAETFDSILGSKDIDVVMVNLLADKFNALKEREGKPDVRENTRALKRLFKEVPKIKEVLSANKVASIKIPELLDYVTLQISLPREEVEKAASSFFAKIGNPIDQALAQAGLTADDIDLVELLGGGVRTPKVVENLEHKLPGKNMSVHLNGDEAMCFGSAFIASNSSSNFKVSQILMTNKCKYSVKMKISPLNESETLSVEEQQQEGIEEAEIINYFQEFDLFNTSDYMGKSKGISLNYNKNMKVELFKKINGNDAEEQELIDTFLFEDLESRYSSALDYQKNEQQKAKKKAAKKKEKEANKTKDGNSTDEEKEVETPKEDPAEDDKPVPNPKVKISVEFSRSGYMQISKASVGYKDGHMQILDPTHVRKEFLLTAEQMRGAKQRYKWYLRRDEDKIKKDIAINDFEAQIYKMKDWLREEENEVFVEQEEREKYIEQLNEWEEWLYEDGANQPYTVYEKKYKNMTKDMSKYEARKEWNSQKKSMIDKTQKSIANYRKKTEALKESKPWITEEERNDVLEKVTDFDTWFAEVVSKEEGLKPHEDSKMEIKDVMTKAKQLQKLFTKVSGKKKPKEEKKEEPEDFADDEEGEKKSSNSTEEEQPESKKEEKAENKEEEAKSEDL